MKRLLENTIVILTLFTLFSFMLVIIFSLIDDNRILNNKLNTCRNKVLLLKDK